LLNNLKKDLKKISKGLHEVNKSKNKFKQSVSIEKLKTGENV